VEDGIKRRTELEIKEDQVNLVKFSILLHKATEELLSDDFLLENTEIETNDLLQKIYKQMGLSLEARESLQKTTIYEAFFIYLPKLAGRLGWDVKFVHELGTLNSLILFVPNLEKLLMRNLVCDG
jgi:hypothetical protein